jgi:hypothetical protein
MSDEDDDDFKEDEDDEEIGGEDLDGLPSDIFLIAGLQCLDEKRIFAAGFVREKGKPAQLNVEYSIDAHRLEILTAPFERFFSEEAYYTIIDNNDERVAVLVLENLELVHMEIGHDITDEDELKIYLVYNIENATMQKPKKQN